MVNNYLKAYERCCLCGHRCGKNRVAGELGECGLGVEVLVSSVSPHFGEEPELVGLHGSGTIFLAGCNLNCQFCQNWELSQAQAGSPVTLDQLADFMLQLERRGCHNVNWVTPTPFTPSLLAALEIARERGLTVPLVYNCGGYETNECLSLCAGRIDIYMPDVKYSQNDLAATFSGAPNYVEFNQQAIKEMHRQVGDLVVAEGVARRGLLVRHLVLPGHRENTREVLNFLAQEISPHTYINIMDQYRPCYRASTLPQMDQRLSTEEYEAALSWAQQAGLYRGFKA